MKAIIKGAASVVFFATPLSGHAQADSFSIYYPSGITIPDAVQTAYLDSLLYAGKIPGNGPVRITGYADEPGGAELNKMIADKRAASVKAYLLSSGMEEGRIVQCIGAGNLLHTGNDDRQRRVDIICPKSPRMPVIASSLKASARTDSSIASAAKASADSVAAEKKRMRSLRDLGKMKEDELLVIENLLFKVSTTEIVKESLPVLNELVDVLKDYPRLKIRIEGHVCCGTKSKETDKLKLGYSLSRGRAETVRNYLQEHQIAAARLSFAGFGFSRPKVYPEITQEDMSLNRRVEIRVISN
jgi:outer membrane protein OmpA-like peptidoglycan-associated protein